MHAVCTVFFLYFLASSSFIRYSYVNLWGFFFVPCSSIKILQIQKKHWNAYNKFYILTTGRCPPWTISSAYNKHWYSSALLSFWLPLVILSCELYLTVYNVFLIGSLKHITCVGYCFTGWDSTSKFYQLATSLEFSFLKSDVAIFNHYWSHNLWTFCIIKYWNVKMLSERSSKIVGEGYLNGMSWKNHWKEPGEAPNSCLWRLARL